MEHNITDIVERRADTKSEVDFFLYMWYLPKPIISADAGLLYWRRHYHAMMSDLVIAADNASFGNPEIVLGFTPEIPMEHWKLPFNKATEWYFMGKYFSAEEMREMGMVNEVVPYGNLEERVMQVAEQVARIPAESHGDDEAHHPQDLRSARLCQHGGVYLRNVQSFPHEHAAEEYAEL